MADKKISILFGSGVSLYSDLPNVGKITDTILNADNVARNGDMNYYLYKNPETCNYSASIQLLLDYLKDIIEKYHTHAEIRYGFNYEELYYLLYQISESESKEYENPALYPLIQKILTDFSDELGLFDNDLTRYMNEAKRYIHYIIYQLLQLSNGNVSQFDIISKLLDKTPDIDVYTLNHDILLETYFAQSNLDFNFGFEKSDKISFFNKSLLAKTEGLNLFKLHGSIDWFIFQDKNGSSNLYKVPLDYDAQIDRYYTLDERLHFTDGLPYFLIGTFNKMLNYLSGYYEIVFDTFKNRILNTDKIIISGYGFCDKGINTRITHFAHQPGKELVIVHPDKKQLEQTARGSFHINLLNNPSVRFVEKKFEEITLDEI
ncbi:MAG: SIR2 family protein [Bacteroidota bacterium]|nr:MAG: SIR2 family protein [Bacteroidota bacterium]